MLAIELLLPYSNGDLRLEDGVFLQASRLAGHGLEVRGSGGLAGCRRAHRFQVGLGAALVVPARAFDLAVVSSGVDVSYSGSVFAVDRVDPACLTFVMQTLCLGGHGLEALGSSRFIDRRRAHSLQVGVGEALVVAARANNFARPPSGVRILNAGSELSVDRDDPTDLGCNSLLEALSRLLHCSDPFRP
jgi:hypothetical protein